MTAAWHDLPLRTITPAFLGRFDVTDPEPAEVPFPVPGLRGVLAYWLRALAGAYLGNRTGRLHDVECAVFGAARAGNAGGPSPILLRADRVRLAAFSIDRTRDDGLRYLMGPGLTDLKKPPPRYLEPGEVTLRVRNNGMQAHGDLFLAALWALRAFGGIGARSRRGFGTVAVDHIPDLPIRHFDPVWLSRDTVADLDDVIGCVTSAISDLGFGLGAGTAAANATPHYPCFAPGHCRHSGQAEDELTRTGGWRAALDTAGGMLWGFRHGASRRTLSPPPPGTHSDGYTDVVQPFLDRQPQKGPLTAAALGLPIPYSDHQGTRSPSEPRKATQRRATVDALIDGTPARRASPLWLRVRHDGSAWRLRSLALYSEWLPPGARLRIRIPSGGRSSRVLRPTEHQVRTELERWFGQPI
jgi:hypothetical protein